MKKIVLTIPDFSVGGAERMVAELASNLDKNKFDVTILVIRKPLQNAIEQSISKDVRIVYLNKDFGFDVKVLIKAFKKMKEIKPDVIHTHLQSFMYLLPYVCLHKVKMLHTIHNIPTRESTGLRRIMLKSLFLCKKAVPVGISNTITTLTNELYHIDFTRTVFNPVDEKLFKPKDTSTDESIIRFVSVGRLESQKNFQLLIDAFAKISRAHQNVILIILGDGSLRPMLEKQIEALGCADMVELLGNVPNVNEYLAQSDVFILTSLYEGLPMTILEAMAVGLPIICTDVGGVRDVIDQNGILINNPTVKNVVAAIEQLLQDGAVRREMAIRSSYLSQQYFIESIAKEYEMLYLK